MARIVFVTLFATALPTAAWGYAVKTTASGAPIRWAAGEVTVELALGDAPGAIDGDGSMAAAAASLDRWQAELGGTGVTLTTIAVDEVETDGGDGVNGVRWATRPDDDDIEVGVLAMTHMTYGSSNGRVADADIVVNAAEFDWFTGAAVDGDVDGDGDADGAADADGLSGTGGGGAGSACRGAFDLESTLAHELGHLLGLKHSDDETAVMYASARVCQIRRGLSDDDQAGLAYLYSGELIAAAGSPTDGAAGCAAAGDAGAAGLFGAALVLGLAALARRARVPVRVARAIRRGAPYAGLVAVVASSLAVRPTPAAAAELAWLGVEQLAGHADVAVRGVVVAQAVRRGARGPETVSTIEVRECLRGPCAARVEVVARGGEIDGVGLWVDAEATVAPGEHVVLLLRRRAPGVLGVVGGVQGVFEIAPSAGAPARATRDLRGQRVWLPDGRPSPGALETTSLADLRRAIARAPQPVRAAR